MIFTIAGVILTLGVLLSPRKAYAGKSDTPAAPDPYATSNAQTQSNIQTAQNQSALNAVGQYNPYGSTDFLRNANGTPYAQVSNLSPALQSLLNSKQGQATGMNSITNQLMGQLNTGPMTAPSVNDVGKNAYQSMAGWLQPTFDAQHTQLEQQLDQRGLPIGSQARQAAETSAANTQNQALTQAAAQAQVQGANEQNTLFGQALQQNQLPYQNLAAIMSGNPTSSLLGSAPGAQQLGQSTVQPTDVAGNVYKSYQAQVNAANQANANAMGGAQGAASLAMMALMLMSDENLKENRKPVDGESVLMRFKNLPVDSYDYKKDAQASLGVPEHRTGTMAQDWAREFGGDGHMIDIGDLTGHMLAAIKALEARTSNTSQKGE